MQTTSPPKVERKEILNARVLSSHEPASRERTVSIIVPVSPRGDVSQLQHLLNSVDGQTYNRVEVLVVAERVSNLTTEFRFPVRWVRVPEGTGASAARNHGVDTAGGDLLAFLDDDVVIHPSWCEEAVKLFADGLVGGASGDAEVDLARFNADYIPRSLRWVVGASYWDTSEITLVHGATGTNFCVRRDSFEEVGGFNESLGPKGDRPEGGNWRRVGAEESDLALRIIRSGKRFVYNPKMRATHFLRRETILPRGIVNRSLHVGFNRAYIHRAHGSQGTISDRQSIVALLWGARESLANAYRSPGKVWKLVSFSCLVVASLFIGYVLGTLEFQGLTDGIDN